MKARQVGLVLALLVGVALAGLVLRVVSEASAPSTLSGIFPVAEEVIDQVLIQSAEGEARLIKTDGEWRIGIHKAFELRLASLWSIAELLRQSQLVAEEPVHHERLGVDPQNAVRVSFYKGESPVEELLIGHWSPQAGLAYVRRPVDDAVFSMPVNLPGVFESNPNAWRNPVVLDLQPEEINTVTLVYPDGRIALEREDAGWAVVTPDGREAGDPAKVQALLQGLAPLLTADFPPDREARDVSFAEPDAAIEIISTGDRPFVVVSFVERDEDSYYVKLADETTVYLFSRAAADQLLRAREDFLP